MIKYFFILVLFFRCLRINKKLNNFIWSFNKNDWGIKTNL